MKIRERLFYFTERIFRATNTRFETLFTTSETEKETPAKQPEPAPDHPTDPLDVSLIQVVLDSQAPRRLQNALIQADEADMLPHETLRDYVEDRDAGIKAYFTLPNLSGGSIFELESLLTLAVKNRQPQAEQQDHFSGELDLEYPPSWEELTRLIEWHSNLSDQYVWLTARYLNLPWPSELLYLQLIDVDRLSADELEQLIQPHIQNASENAELATLREVLNFWNAERGQSALERMQPETLARTAVLSEIPGIAAEILFRRLNSADVRKQPLAKIAQNLGLTREQARQIESIAMRRLSQPPTRYYLKILLHDCQEELEESLLGRNGCIKKSDLKSSFHDPGLIKALAIRCLHKTLAGYADERFVSFRNLYLKSGADDTILAREFDAIEGSIHNLSMPVHCEIAATDLEVSRFSLVCYAASKASHGIFEDYLHEGRITPRKQRAIRLLQVFGENIGGGPATFGEICSAYRYVFPDAACSIRDLRNSLYDYSDQFLPLTDDGFASIARYCEVLKRPGAQQIAIPALPDAEYKAFNAGTLYAEIVDLVDEIGPAPLLEIRAEFTRRFEDKWSANSVFPVLKSTNYFIRMAPGIIGTLPMVDNEKKLGMQSALESEMQVKYYIYAKASQSWFSYPLWNPEVEFQWCILGDGRLPWETYASLLSIANPAGWPISEAEKSYWQKRVDREGKFSLSATPLPLTQMLPTVRDICTLALFIGEKPSISWLDVNRVLGYRIDSRSSMSFLAILAKLGIVRIEDNWLLPIKVCPGQAYRFLNEIVCSHRLNSLWRDIPELVESNPDMKSIWINKRELESLLEQLQSMSASGKPSYWQPSLFDKFDSD